MVDSSVWVDFFNGKITHETDFLSLLLDTKEHTIATCGTVLMELVAGVKPSIQSKILHLLQRQQLIETRTDDFLAAGKMYQYCREKGKTIRSLIDCLIAQLCITHTISLLSSDRDFQMIANYFSLNLIKAH